MELSTGEARSPRQELQHASIYFNHYTRLRRACFGLMLHGIGWDRDNAERLRMGYDSRRLGIKEEIIKLTNGFPLWSQTTHRSEEMNERLAEQSNARDALQRLRKDLRGQGIKGKALTSRTVVERGRVGAAVASVKSCREEGRDRVVEIGAGLSDDAIARWFYEKCGIASIYKLRKEKRVRTVTVDDIALKKIRQLHPNHSGLVDLIREHRKCTKLVSTYLNAEKLDGDGRLRCFYKVYGTNSGRLASSSNPEGCGFNLQNVDGSLKPLLIPDPGE